MLSIFILAFHLLGSLWELPSPGGSRCFPQSANPRRNWPRAQFSRYLEAHQTGSHRPILSFSPGRAHPTSRLRAALPERGFASARSPSAPARRHHSFSFAPPLLPRRLPIHLSGPATAAPAQRLPSSPLPRTTPAALLRDLPLHHPLSSQAPSSCSLASSPATTPTSKNRCPTSLLPLCIEVSCRRRSASPSRR